MYLDIYVYIFIYIYVHVYALAREYACRHIRTHAQFIYKCNYSIDVSRVTVNILYNKHLSQ